MIPLEQVFKEYRMAEKEDDLQKIRAFSDVCKEVASQYRIEKHDEFLGQREQLEKLIKVIP